MSRLYVIPRTPTGHAFVKFHNNNPEVYSELLELARGILKRRRNRWSISSLFEVLRWQRLVNRQTDETLGSFKLSNNYRAFYARLLMLQEPELVDFFDCRESQADYQIFLGE
jgi:hypothetical protein